MHEDLTITIYDCETGGLDHSKHAITEIAAINFDLKTFTVNWEYQTFIKEYDDLIVTDEALAHCLVTREDIAGGKKSSKVVKELIELLESSNYQSGKFKDRGKTITCGHNAIKFDSKFLERIFSANGEDVYKYISEEIHDTISMSKQLWWNKEEKFNLTACCQRAGHKLVGAHSAMNDVRATFELYKYICMRNRNAGIVSESKDGTRKISKVRKYFAF